MRINSAALQRLDGVRLWLEYLGHNAVDCYENPYQVLPTNGDSNFLSRAIQATPGDELKINLNFSTDFDLGAASGVRVTLAIGHTELDPTDLSTSQSWWIDADNLKRSHSFKFFSTWETEISKAEAIRLTFPVPDDNPVEGSKNVMWQYMHLANKGCIAVSVVRGDLTDEVQLYPVHCTDPPPTHRWEATDMPKVISWHWFEPMASENPHPIVFEFRNMVDTNVNTRAATEAGPSRDRTTSPMASNDVASMDEDEMMARALENSRGHSRTAAQAGAGVNGAVSNSNGRTMHGEALRRGLITLPLSATSRAQIFKRKTPHDSGSELQRPARQPRRETVSGSATPGRRFEDYNAINNNNGHDNNEVQNGRPIEPDATRIKREPIDLIDLTQDDEDESAIIKQEVAEGRAPSQGRRETREELQLQLLESEEQERIHRERLKQVQIRKKLGGLRGDSEVVKREE
ncbi:hypothetical protein PRZ48_003971 [Zasmidium cellare]|uniref:Uncharacterized protein n=1 Tax=Zasmidium cellare TaxID=395010 RepID=A0ABR0EXW7_ZASCE|nr:hypothetical protein PRZ48_003971 [Zasmidium cellare]